MLQMWKIYDQIILLSSFAFFVKMLYEAYVEPYAIGQQLSLASSGNLAQECAKEYC